MKNKRKEKVTKSCSNRRVHSKNTYISNGTLIHMDEAMENIKNGSIYGPIHLNQKRTDK